MRESLPLFFALLCIAAYLLYSPGISTPYFGDDIYRMFSRIPTPIWTVFTMDRMNISFYRPLEDLFLIANQAAFGNSTLVLHIVIIGMHALFASVLFIGTLRIGFSRTQGMIAASLMLVAQANVSAVISNDTFSQVAGTLLGVCSLYYLYRALVATNFSQKPYREWYWSGVLLFTLSLFAKESSASFLAGIILLLLFFGRKNISRSQRFIDIASGAMPFLAATLLYMIMRLAAHSKLPAVGQGRYDFYPGLSVVKNAGLLILNCLLPYSSVDLYLAALAHHWLILLASGILISLLVFLLARVMLQYRLDRRVLLLACMVLVSVFPAAAMNHVSELYSYNTMPFIVLLVGIGLGDIIDWMKIGRGAGNIALLFAELLLFLNAISVYEKTALLDHTGKRTEIVVQQIAIFAPKVSPAGSLFLVNPPMHEPQYSMFLSHDFFIVIQGDRRINELAGRPDINVKIVGDDDWKNIRPSPGSIALTLEGDRVKQIFP